MKYPHRFNVDGIVRAILPHRNEPYTASARNDMISTLLGAAGCHVKSKTVAKWIERGSIPSPVLATMMRSLDIDMRDLVVPNMEGDRQ